jgi:hypothetical protein
VQGGRALGKHEEGSLIMKLRSFRGHIEPGVWPGAVIGVAYLGFALGMIFQPGRFYTTPAYGTLTQVFDIRIWGAVYLVTAVLLGAHASLHAGRLFGIVAHILALIVTSVWWLAFVIRWLTDDKTTAVNVISWLVFLLVIARSASLIPMATRITPDPVTPTAPDAP